MRRAGLGVLILLLGFLVSLGGCQGEGEPAPKYRIAVIPKGLTHEFWQSIHRGALRAAQDLEKHKGIVTEIIWDGPLRERDALAQIRIVDRRISTRVDGIVLAPQHSQTMVAPVERAREQDIPVVIIDSGLADQDLIVKYVATNNYNGGWLAAKRLLEVLQEDREKLPRDQRPDTLNLILLRYQIGSESTDQREKGFEDYIAERIKKNKDGEPVITWLSRDKYAGATKDSALKEAAPLLNNMRAKRIDGIFAPNESSANGMLDALRSLELNRKVRLVGFDSSEPLLQAVREGDIQGLILQDPYKMGYLGVWTLVHHLEGFDVAPGGDKVLGTGEHVITRANLDARSTKELFNPDFQRQRTITPPNFTESSRVR